MSWRDREWAKLRDDELEALYGFRRPAPPRRGVSLRTFVWTATALLTAAVAAFATMQMPRGNPLQAPEITPSSIHGTRLAPSSNWGADAVCTDMEYVRDTGWRCDNIDLNVAHVPVIPATPYNGPCAHLKVVETDWVCISATPVGASA